MQAVTPHSVLSIYQKAAMVALSKGLDFKEHGLLGEEIAARLGVDHSRVTSTIKDLLDSRKILVTGIRRQTLSGKTGRTCVFNVYNEKEQNEMQSNAQSELTRSNSDVFFSLDFDGRKEVSKEEVAERANEVRIASGKNLVQINAACDKKFASDCFIAMQMEISADEALYLLEHRNSINRNFKVPKAKSYAKLMRDGQWESLSRIVFDPSGVMVEGQKRMAALANVGGSQSFIVELCSKSSTVKGVYKEDVRTTEDQAQISFSREGYTIPTGSEQIFCVFASRLEAKVVGKQRLIGNSFGAKDVDDVSKKSEVVEKLFLYEKEFRALEAKFPQIALAIEPNSRRAIWSAYADIRRTYEDQSVARRVFEGVIAMNMEAMGMTGIRANKYFRDALEARRNRAADKNDTDMALIKMFLELAAIVARDFSQKLDTDRGDGFFKKFNLPKPPKRLS
jgi:hypothetical protein